MASEIFLPFKGYGGTLAVVEQFDVTASTGVTTRGKPVKIETATAGATTIDTCDGGTTAEVVLGVALETCTAGQKCLVAIAREDQLFSALPDDAVSGYSVGTAYGLVTGTCKPDTADTTNGMFTVMGTETIDKVVRLVGFFTAAQRLVT